MQSTRHTRAFTLVELLVGLLVTSVLLSAVATLAFAMSSANAAFGDTAFQQAQLRQATLHLSELIGKCSLICAAPGTDLVVWRRDDNGDEQINVNELVYLERGPSLDRLRLWRFASTSNPAVVLADLMLSTTKSVLIASHAGTCVSLISSCARVQFGFDAAPPRTRLVSVSFGLTENNVVRQYETVVALRAWAGHLLGDASNAIVADDD